MTDETNRGWAIGGRGHHVAAFDGQLRRGYACAEREVQHAHAGDEGIGHASATSEDVQEEGEVKHKEKGEKYENDSDADDRGKTGGKGTYAPTAKKMGSPYANRGLKPNTGGLKKKK